MLTIQVTSNPCIQVSLDRIENDRPDHVADVRRLVNRRPAEIHPHFAGPIFPNLPIERPLADAQNFRRLLAVAVTIFSVLRISSFPPARC
jgi:hypothetical protein